MPTKNPQFVAKFDTTSKAQFTPSFTAASGGTAPTLSSPTATSITATGATIGCTVTF